MGKLKKKIAKKLHEAKYMVQPEDLDQVVDKLGKDDVVKFVDEAEGGDENNPWAICTASVGREDKDKFERCVKDVKKQYGISEDESEAPEPKGKVDVADLQRDVQKFLDKLDLGQFKNILSRIDKPIEKAELLAAFAERIGVPRNKLASLLSTLRQTAENDIKENINPKMKKDELIETVNKVNKKVIKRIKKKDING